VDGAQDGPGESSPGESGPDAPVDATVGHQDADPCQPLVDPQWTIETVDDDPGFKARVAAAVGPDERVRLAYNVATSPDGWSDFELRVAEQSDQGFLHEVVVPSEGFSNEFPTIAVDARGVTHVVYNRYVPAEEQIDVFLVSGSLDTGFSAPVNLTNTLDADENGSVLASGPDGTLHVAYMTRVAIPDQPGKYTYATGYVAHDDGGPKDALMLATDTLPFTGVPEQSLTVAPDGTVHVVYLKPGLDPSHGVVYHRARGPQGWTQELRLTSDQDNATGVSVFASSTNALHLTYGKGKVDITLTHRSFDLTTLGPEQALTSSTQDRPYYLGLKGADTGAVHVAFWRLVGSNGDIFFASGENDVFEPEEVVTQTPSEDEQFTSLALGRCGEAYVAFLENLSTAPDGRVLLATRR